MEPPMENTKRLELVQVVSHGMSFRYLPHTFNYRTMSGTTTTTTEGENTDTDEILQSSKKPRLIANLEKLHKYYDRYNICLDKVRQSSRHYLPHRFVRVHPLYLADNNEQGQQTTQQPENSTTCFYQNKTLCQLFEEVRKHWLETTDMHDNGERAPRSCCPYPQRVSWLATDNPYYAIPATFPLHKSPLFQLGHLYGQDVSSGAAVQALLSSRSTVESMRVLDLCCAPGLKLCAIADALSENDVVIGVDVAPERLQVCKRVLSKYQVEPYCAYTEDSSGERDSKDTNRHHKSRRPPRIRVYEGDGRYFGKSDQSPNLVFDSCVARRERLRMGKQRKRLNKHARNQERKLLQKVLQEKDDSVDGHMKLFDCVLVDAECSTDGSLRHLQKCLQQEDGSISTLAPILNSKATEDMFTLQKQLLSTGFRLLRKGGFLVYATCSFAEEQNENVVQWLLRSHPGAVRLVPISFGGGYDASKCSLPGTVRFIPSAVSSKDESGTSGEFFGDGFFLAKLQKLEDISMKDETIATSCTTANNK